MALHTKHIYLFLYFHVKMCIHVALFCFVVAIAVVYLVFFFCRMFLCVFLVILTPFVAKTGPK